MAETLAALHAPPMGTSVLDLNARRTPWHARLIYEELLLLQLAVVQRKARAAKERATVLQITHPLLEVAREILPFEPTAAQARVLGDLEKDLGNSTPMNRLLQGDVGSGKTAVALTAAVACAREGLQSVIMAPTELLAEQHARVALRLLTAADVRVDLLTGSASAPERRRILAQLADGTIQVVVGTHALIQKDLRFAKLALCIIDEQHRFGVMQRARLLEMGRESLGTTPHTMVMTATPIPRTLAMTAYGDLDVSVIDTLPPGHQPVDTTLFREHERNAMYAKVRTAVEMGRQAFVVFPLVEESEGKGMAHLRDATQAAEELATVQLQGLSVQLLHGRMASDDKDSIMRSFVRGDIGVLVATTVIEVGINVPNATVMVIEHAERFGLSQLHQLRGRVGRGKHRSACFLLAQYAASDEAWQRLMVMTKSQDGFEIAEQDLAIRGPGDFVGTRQSGLPALTIANLARDGIWLTKARHDAMHMIECDPTLSDDCHLALARSLVVHWKGRAELARIG